MTSALLAGCTVAPTQPSPTRSTSGTTAAGAVVPTTGASPSPARQSPSPASPTPLAPPYVASATWVTLATGRSLRVRPTAAGRRTPGGDDEAWAEVLRLQPDAGTPGMRAQLDCHWDYARLVAPDKPSWNLEPWRPVVSADEMVRTRCNPGGAEE